MADQPNNTNPTSAEEERYVAAIAEASKTPEEREREAAADPTAERGAPEDTRSAEERARDPAGRFAPKPPPFEGYEKLDPKAREYFDKLQHDTKQAQNRAAAAQRELAKARQTAPTPRPRPAAAPAPRSDAPQPQPRKTPKWDEGSKEHPEFYASVEERIKAAEDELGRKLTAIEERTAQLDQKAQRLDQIASRVEARERVEHAKSAQAILDADLSPDWRYHVGWKDEAGADVPADEQAYSPVLEAYLGSLHPDVRKLKEAQLESGNPYMISSVLQEFEYLHEWAKTGQRPERAQPGTPAAAARPPKDPRQEALNDRHPRPNASVPRNAPAQPVSRMDSEEAAFAAAVTPENMQKYRAGQYRGV